VEKSNLPTTQKILTSAIKGQAIMIFAYDHRGIITTDSSLWNKCDSSVLKKKKKKTAQKNAQKLT
jgi:hypothetical protein